MPVKKEEKASQNTRRQSTKFHRQTTNYVRGQFLCKPDIVVP